MACTDNPRPSVEVETEDGGTERDADGADAQDVDAQLADAQVADVPVMNPADCPTVGTFAPIDAAELDIVVLDGDRVFPRRVDFVKFRWSVLSRPLGSTAQPVEDFLDPNRPANGGRADDRYTPAAQLFMDLAGVFVVELSVEVEGCPARTARQTITVIGQVGLHIQLVWHTPNDPDETDDTGTDVDLHLLHPLGGPPDGRGWGVLPFDCHSANPAPDWGRAGDPDDNPRLYVDDSDGAGPEDLFLRALEDTAALGAPYRVGVEYFGDPPGEWGHSEATVRVFEDGVPLGEFTRVIEVRDLWEVAELHRGADGLRVVELP